jgi:hypothetical protein
MIKEEQPVKKIKKNKMTKGDKRTLIVDHLKKEGRSISWLAKQLGIVYRTFYSIMVHQTIELSDANLKKINKILGTDFK